MYRTSVSAQSKAEATLSRKSPNRSRAQEIIKKVVYVCVCARVFFSFHILFSPVVLARGERLTARQTRDSNTILRQLHNHRGVTRAVQFRSDATESRATHTTARFVAHRGGAPWPSVLVDGGQNLTHLATQSSLHSYTPCLSLSFSHSRCFYRLFPSIHSLFALEHTERDTAVSHSKR